MSDFLARVAARAVGQAAVAKPRLPALFEPAEPTVAGIEIVETEVAPAPRTRSSVQDAPAASAPGAATAGPRAGEAGPVAPADKTSPATPEPKQPETGRLAEREVIRARETVREVETLTAVPAGPEASPPAAVPPPVAVPATPAIPVAAPPPMAAVGSAAREAPPAVRVHIGRLEVRANLQEPPLQRPGRDAPRPQELSLADYLRGRREHG